MDLIAGKAAPDVLNYLLCRRSVLADQLQDPGPTNEQLNIILQASSRVPDHGKVVPYYFLVFEGEGRIKLGDILSESYSANHPSAREEPRELCHSNPDSSTRTTAITMLDCF